MHFSGFWGVISRDSLAMFPEVRNRNETESRLRVGQKLFDSWGLIKLGFLILKAHRIACDCAPIKPPFPEENIFLLQIFSSFFFSVFLLFHKKNILLLQLFILYIHPPFPSPCFFSFPQKLFSCSNYFPPFLSPIFFSYKQKCHEAGHHNLRSFLAANSTQNYFLTARMLSFL